MSKPTEEPDGAGGGAPFVYRREIFWGDTDTALIVYTGRFVDYALEAIESWYRTHLDTDWYRLNVDRKIGTPFVHVEMDFVSPLTPKDQLAVEVRVDHLGTSSLGFRVFGYANDDRLSFRGHMVCAFIDIATKSKIPIPDEFRDRIAAYQAST